MNASSDNMKTPIRIGYTLSLTGPVAENTRTAQLAHQIWLEDINSKGGLLGRPVELLCYDDQSKPETVAQLYRDLLAKDKVDLLLGGYGTNTLAAALPVVLEHNRLMIGLMGLGVNDKMEYPHYYAMIPTGPDPNAALTEGFFEVGATKNMKTVALLSAEAEFSKNPILGAKKNVRKYGLDIVYEQTYPLNTEDFAVYLQDIQNTGAEILFLCSYLTDSIGLIQALHAADFSPKLVGGAMIGPQAASVKTALGPLLNGIVNYEYWMPVKGMLFPGVTDFLKRYQQKAVSVQADALGYYVAPLAYAQLQVLAQAIEATGSLDDLEISNYCQNATFDTVVGSVQFGKNGEWMHPRVLQVQFQGIRDNSIATFMDNSKQVVLCPSEFASGTLQLPK